MTLKTNQPPLGRKAQLARSVLYLLRKNGEMSLVEMGAALNEEHTSLNEALRSLLAAGDVTREQKRAVRWSRSGPRFVYTAVKK